MSENLNFRSAFNGFHREDVVHYIEYLNTKHTAEVNQLNAQLEQLNAQNTAPADVTELQDQLSAAQEINDQLQARIAELEERISAAESAADHTLEDRCQELERQLAEARAATHVIQELEAYRRAERAEREAKERAELVYRQANGALADATVKVDEAFSQIGDLTERVSQQLSQLQQAVDASRQALADASASLYSVTPGNN